MDCPVPPPAGTRLDCGNGSAVGRKLFRQQLRSTPAMAAADRSRIGPPTDPTPGIHPLPIQDRSSLPLPGGGPSFAAGTAVAGALPPAGDCPLLNPDPGSGPDADGPESSVPGLPEPLSASIFLWSLCFLMLGSATAFWSLRECRGDLNAVPGAQADDVFYDNIAWNLSRGRGFSLGFSDWEWLRPYRKVRDGVDRKVVLQHQTEGKTTSRAPAYPWLLAGTWRILGRRWDVVRVSQIVLLSAGLAGFLVWAGRRMGSRVLPLVASATLAADFSVLSTAGQLMTEPLAVLAIAMALVGVDRASQSGLKRQWLMAGMLFGVAILVRSTLVGWMVLGGLGYAAWLLWLLLRRRPVWLRLQQGTAYGFGILLVCLPWWQRNCDRAGAFAPFGSAGSIGMAGGYCDGCQALNGNWFLPAVVEAQAAAEKTAGFGLLSLAEQEHRIGAESSRRAREWMREHVRELPALAWNKALNHLAIQGGLPWPLTVVNLLLLGSAFAGSLLSLRGPGKWILIATSLSVLTTSLTWSHYGRFSIPIRPLWHLASAWTIVAFWVWVLGLDRRPSRNELPVEPAGSHGSNAR